MRLGGNQKRLGIDGEYDAAQRHGFHAADHAEQHLLILTAIHAGAVQRRHAAIQLLHDAIGDLLILIRYDEEGMAGIRPLQHEIHHQIAHHGAHERIHGGVGIKHERGRENHQTIHQKYAHADPKGRNQPVQKTCEHIGAAGGRVAAQNQPKAQAA